MTQRPTITPDVLAAIISAAPERLQKKLDREPRAADAWTWTDTNGLWSVSAGEETVRIPVGVINDVAQVQCSCLLSPRCFHVLAVLNVAEIAVGDEIPSDDADTGTVEQTGEGAWGQPTAEVEQQSSQATRGPDDSDERPQNEVHLLTEAQHRAARLMFEACAGILATGLRAAGAQLQSRLLRAIHECRSEGLHRVAAGGLRLMNNLRLLRDGNDQFNSSVAEADFCEVLETCVRLNANHDSLPAVSEPSLAARGQRGQTLSGQTVSTSSRLPSKGSDPFDHGLLVSVDWIGIARRTFQPFNSLKLHALFCEPILTRSGYSGVVTWLMSDDGWMGTISDVQPGDAKRIPQAWQSGVSLAGLSMSHRDLSQKCLLISKATRSVDGRIGGGESARAVAIDGQGWDAPPIAARFQTPLPDQIQKIFNRQSTIEFLSPAGTDLVFLTVIVAGYAGQQLIVHDAYSGTMLRLSIAIDDDALAFRSSLQMLSRAPGLALRCIGRVEFKSAGCIQLLAVAPVTLAVPDQTGLENSHARHAPNLVVPDSTPVISIGLAEVTRSQLSQAEPQSVNVAGLTGDTAAASSGSHHDDAVERWLRAIIIGGRHAIPQGLVTSAVRDAARLKASLRPAAASMLHALTQSTIATRTELTGIRFSEQPETLAIKWLAASIGTRAAARYLQLNDWLVRFESLSPEKT